MHPCYKWLLKNAAIIVAAGNLVIEVGRAIKDIVSPSPKAKKPGSGPPKR